MCAFRDKITEISFQRQHEKKMPPACPSCHSTNVLPIVWGLPANNAMEAAKRRKVVFGGCVIDDDPPRWHCENCGLDFGSRGDL